MPLVIFDGPEAAGKSTIIDALREEWGENCRLRSWGPRKSWLEYCQSLFDDIQACDADPTLLIVWSRCWASRTVYNKLLNQGQVVPPEVTRELEDIVIRSGGLLVLVTSPVVVLLERRLARLADGNAKPDHALDVSEELGEFQKYSRGRKWVQALGIDDTAITVRWLMTTLVRKNPECRMDLRLENARAALTQ